MPEQILLGHPRQMTLFVRATKDASFGVGVAWKERDGWKTKAASLGKHLTEADAALSEINTVVKDDKETIRHLILSYIRWTDERRELCETVGEGSGDVP